MGKRYSVRPWLLLAALFAPLLPACQDGHLDILGYTTRPNYDPDIHTIRVNIFENRTNVTGLEIEIQQSLTKMIQWKSPMKVVGLGSAADTELSGIIRRQTKNILNRTQQNETREEEVVLECEVVWRDVRTGQVLTDRWRKANPPVIPTIIAAPGIMPTPAAIGDAAAPPPGAPPLGGPAPGGPLGTLLPGAVIVRSKANVIPELGVSNRAARQKESDLLAQEIVEMMESPWTNRP